jgi:pimeloyl-ACP methyl ester carboxylesterase
MADTGDSGAPAQSGFVERIVAASDGLSLYARDYNPESDNPVALLFLSGLVRTSRDAHATALRYAAQGWRVIAPDYRGRGRSAFASDWRSYDAPVLAGDVLSVLTALEIDRAVAIGTSMGGILSLVINLLRPTLFAGVALNDIGPDVAAGGAARIVSYVGRDWRFKDWDEAVAHLKPLFAHGPCKTEEDWREMAYGTFASGADGLLRQHWDTGIARMMQTQQSDAATARRLWAAFRALGHRPTLLLRGANSDILSHDTFTAMQQARPDMMTATVPDVGHTPSLREPEALAALDALLARVTP